MDILPRRGGNGNDDKRRGIRAIFIFMIGMMVGITLYSWKNPSQPAPVQKPIESSGEVSQENGLSSGVLPEKPTKSSRRTQTTRVFDTIFPAVVSIHTERVYTSQRGSYFGDSFFDAFLYGPRYRQYKASGLGSGFIVNEEGYILTNEHVVHDAIRIKVVLPEGREFEAKLINADFMSDIAVLKIDGENLPTVKLGNSDEILIGEDVIAIGNPFGNLLNDEYGRFPLPSVSRGIASAVNRNFLAPREGIDVMYRNMIQTDVAINQGNSGGPLINYDGEVIGVNTLIFVEEGTFQQVGFALPINRVKALMDEILQYGAVRRVYPGLSVVTIDEIYAAYLGLKASEGVLITNVVKGSPAEKAGLKILDVIVEVNEKNIRNNRDIKNLFLGAITGDIFHIKYIRAGKNFMCRLVLS